MHISKSSHFILKQVLIVLLFTAINTFAAESDVEQGRKIYMEGVLPSGKPLEGFRAGEVLTGKQAACVLCHRPSGMGSVEGDIQVPPITGNYLYRQGGMLLATMDPRSGKRFNQAHDPYTDQSVATAIREGVNVAGEQMNVLMPRYQLKDDEVRYLTAFLKQLSSKYSPGATKDTVYFATVITPDVDPERRRMLLNVLQRGFMRKNGSTVVSNPRISRRHMVTAAEMVLGTERKWDLQVWDLKGPAETWRSQLEEFYKSRPVFALISGLSGSTWQPVHDFCEQSHIPCWLPSVDLPVESGGNFYNLYFQRGVALEAEVLAKYLSETPDRVPRRLIQLYHDDVLGNSAASVLSRASKEKGINVESRPLLSGNVDSVKSALSGLTEKDAVMLWMRPEDCKMLKDVQVPNANIYISGRMSGAEKSPLPKVWKKSTRMIFPYELPDKRLVNLNYFHRWMRVNEIPIEDEPLQAEAYFALDYMTDTMTEMLDNLYRDYLLERAEYMLSKSEGSKAEIRDRSRQVMRWSTRTPRGTPQEEALVEQTVAGKEKNIPGTGYAEVPSKSTTIYPRMSLGVEQRFASKGAYVVKFDDNEGSSLAAVSSWIVP